MNKLFSLLLILALFVFEVKTDVIPQPYKKKIERLIEYLKENGLWVDLLRYVDYSEDYAIHWCMQYESFHVCEVLVDDYLDDYLDDYDDDDD